MLNIKGSDKVCPWTQETRTVRRTYNTIPMLIHFPLAKRESASYKALLSVDLTLSNTAYNLCLYILKMCIAATGTYTY